MFGLGESTGLGLPGEETGFVPTVEWKQRRFRQQWYAGDTANFSIGQGTMLATPVQMARAFAALANGGHLVRPQLVRSVVSGSGAVIYSFDSAGSEPLTIKQATCDVVTQGLRKAVQQDTFPTGTGYRAKVQGIDIIGKTGTAQVVQKKPGEDGVVDINTIPYEYRDHAWFVCLVMDKQPRIVVSVLKEHSGHGGDVSAPVAGALIRAIYTGEEIAVPQVVAAAPGSVGAPQASGERETSF
jgi:penicillin-binding protein 2